jgi:cysteinyl-tRNA synthetase
VTSKPFARFWIHGEHLLVDGEKMSKSKGNFYTLRDLLEKGYDAQSIRYLLLKNQYRKQLNFTLDGLAEASLALRRIKDFLFRLESSTLAPGSEPEVSQAVATARQELEDGLDDDLNTSRALAAVFDLVRECNTALDREKLKEANRAEILQWFKEVDNRLAIVPAVEDLVQRDDEIEALVAQRTEARRNRDFAASDRIRKELADRGITIEDTREGTKWRRK